MKSPLRRNHRFLEAACVDRVQPARPCWPRRSRQPRPLCLAALAVSTPLGRVCSPPPRRPRPPRSAAPAAAAPPPLGRAHPALGHVRSALLGRVRFAPPRFVQAAADTRVNLCGVRRFTTMTPVSMRPPWRGRPQVHDGDARKHAAIHGEVVDRSTTMTPVSTWPSMARSPTGPRR